VTLTNEEQAVGRYEVEFNTTELQRNLFLSVKDRIFNTNEKDVDDEIKIL
jgi:hypothetical protein